MSLEIIILAAGQGTRMRSSLPKVLHQVGGTAMLARVIDTALTLQPSRIHVVIGSAGEQVRQVIKDRYAGTDTPITFARQEQQRGTGHAVQQAVQQAEPGIAGETRCLVLYGDVPLVDRESLQELMAALDNSDATLGVLTATLENTFGLGRILRDPDDNVVGIVEQKDASNAQLAIAEINSGIMLCPFEMLNRWLGNLDSDNSQGEFYLTDIVSMAVNDGHGVCGTLCPRPELLAGVNSRVDLALAERTLQQLHARKLMEGGVTLHDPARIDIRGAVEFGIDCEIDINVVLEGSVKAGNNVSIGPNCVIRDAVIGDNCRINANSVIEDSELGNGCHIGPFARLRPDTRLGDRVRIGNFVEVKKSVLGEDSKANHLAYVGDSKVGSNVNIGAGVITCNYDGANKHQTVIGDDVFVGSDTQIVAPVTIGSGATIGAGATITRDIDAGSLAITRAPFRQIAHWQRPLKKT